jgi:hypothetical protein
MGTCGNSLPIWRFFVKTRPCGKALDEGADGTVKPVHHWMCCCTGKTLARSHLVIHEWVSWLKRPHPGGHNSLPCWPAAVNPELSSSWLQPRCLHANKQGLPERTDSHLPSVFPSRSRINSLPEKFFLMVVKLWFPFTRIRDGEMVQCSATRCGEILWRDSRVVSTREQQHLLALPVVVMCYVILCTRQPVRLPSCQYIILHMYQPLLPMSRLPKYLMLRIYTK